MIIHYHFNLLYFTYCLRSILYVGYPLPLSAAEPARSKRGQQPAERRAGSAALCWSSLLSVPAALLSSPLSVCSAAQRDSAGQHREVALPAALPAVYYCVLCAQPFSLVVTVIRYADRLPSEHRVLFIF